MTRAELARIIARAEQDLHDLDRAIKRQCDRRSALEAELDALYEKRDRWDRQDLVKDNGEGPF